MGDYREVLGFTEAWFGLGLMTEERLAEMGREYESGDDKNTEHWRYGVFRAYLRDNRPLNPEIAESLYEIGSADSDYFMGGAIMHDIVSLAECPESLLQKVKSSGRKHLFKGMNRRRQQDPASDGVRAIQF